MDQVLEALKKLKDVYQDTLEVSVGEDLKVKLRMLTSEDEIQVHSFAMKYEQGLGYLYAVKRATLGKAIIGLNDNDIPDFIEDGEKVERSDWLMDNVLNGWSQVLIDEVWSKYIELIEKSEKKMSETIKEEKEEEVKEESKEEKNEPEV